MDEIVDYKGIKYKLVHSGRTEYGHRTLLEFRDGSGRQFWVGTKLVDDGLDQFWEARPRRATGRAARPIR